MGPAEDAETQLEDWRRLLSCLSRLGIAVPDHGELVTSVENLVYSFDKDTHFA